MRVSVIIPTRDGHDLLREAVASVNAQIHDELELIVVDDGSEVPVENAVRKMWRGRPESMLKIVRQERSNGNVARNRGLRESTGDFIQFLDSDDYLLPWKIANHFERMKTSGFGLDVVFGPPIHQIHKEDGSILMFTRDSERLETPVEKWLGWQMAQTGTLLWRRQALESIGGWNEAYPCCQDNELMLRAWKAGLKIDCHAGSGAVYRSWSNQSISVRNPMELGRIKLDLLEQMCATLKEQKSLLPSHLEIATGTLISQVQNIGCRLGISDANSFLAGVKASEIYRPHPRVLGRRAYCQLILGRIPR